MEVFNKDLGILSKEIFGQELNVVVPCNQEGQVADTEREKLKGIETPSLEHVWKIVLTCNQGGSLNIDPYGIIHADNAMEVLDFALQHPDTPNIIEAWRNIDWDSYGMSGQEAHPTQYEFGCMHPIVYDWGVDEGYQRYLKSHGIE